MNKKIVLNDDSGNPVEVDLKIFIGHINQYHKNDSIHEEGAHKFTVNKISLLNFNFLKKQVFSQKKFSDFRRVPNVQHFLWKLVLNLEIVLLPIYIHHN